jgi:hypothetical protein
MRAILDEATDPWGIKVNRVELKNIIPPKEIQDAMERQMKAERERRESILKAEGEKKSAILIAEGEKESAILRAEAVKQQKIKEAEGQAEALMKVQSALADSIKLLNEADASDAAANSGLYPVFFIRGIVTEPEPTVFATDEPETIPSIALTTTATFAGPPENLPTSELLILIKNSAIPVLSKNAPNIINTTINLEQTLIGVDKIPSFP